MTDPVVLDVKVATVEASISLLAQRIEVHIAGEIVQRALTLEKLETLRLTVENAALQKFNDLTQRYDLRLSAMEQTTNDHIKRCDLENAREDKARLQRQGHIYTLYIGIVICLLGIAGQYILK